jgi:hypothetical protein
MFHLEPAPAPPTVRIAPRRMFYVEPREPWSETRWAAPQEHVLQPPSTCRCSWTQQLSVWVLARRRAVPGRSNERPSFDPAPGRGSAWNLPTRRLSSHRMFHVEPRRRSGTRRRPARSTGRSRVSTSRCSMSEEELRRESPRLACPVAPMSGRPTILRRRRVVPRGTCRRSRPPWHAGCSTWNLPPLWTAVPRRSFHVEPAEALVRRPTPVVPRGTSATSSEPGRRSITDHRQKPPVDEVVLYVEPAGEWVAALRLLERLCCQAVAWSVT